MPTATEVYRMGRLRVRRLPPGTHDLLLKLTNRHVHAQIVDRAAGTVLVAVHTTEPVCSPAASRPINV